MNTLANRLRAAREALTPPMTQRRVATVLERSPSAVNLWETGKNEPSASQLAKLSSLYKVSTDWLLGVESKTTMQTISAGKEMKISTVPIVKANDLARWCFEKVLGAQQTSASYPAGTAAAITVSSDALGSICPKGSIVVVAKGHEPEDGAIVAAVTLQSADPVIRRYVTEAGVALLVADDNRYPSYSLLEGVSIIGVVVEVTTRKVLA